MKKIPKRVISFGMALCMSSLLAVSGDAGIVKAEEPTPFNMSQSSTTGEEDWSKLRIDMGGPETNSNSGNLGTPLANGLFSARENGGVQEDVFPLNHSTFWSGDPEYRDFLYEGNEGYENSPETRSAAYNKLVDTLKQAYSEGVSKEERDTLMESIAGTTQDMWLADLHSAFISAGRMKLAFPELTGTTDYSRILDLDTATSEIGFKKDGVAYQRETFMSNPDNVMVTRITNEADSPMGMELSLQLHGNAEGKSDDNKITVDKENNEVIMTQRAPYDFGASRWSEDRGTLLEARAKIVLPGGGDISPDGTTLKVSGAKEILVLYTCETSFKDAFTNPSDSGVDYSGKVRETLDNASAKTYDELRERHLDEYRSLFRRFWIDMDGSNITAGNGAAISPYEYARHYQYGRYINISCERANSVMPHGLLGMWSTDWKGPNEGAYFLNENMEKMQAIKGAGNLADSSGSQYNYITSWTNEQTGQRTAQEIYGAEDGAWMMSHSTGIWAKSGMWGGTVEYGSWLSGGIWALDSLYDKYDYTEDIELLKQYYPLLEGAAKFALSTLIDVDGVNGELKGYKVVAPSGSPEHWYWVGNTKVAFDAASTCDTLLYYNLFNMMESGAKDLKRAGISYDEALLERALDARSQMMPLEMFIDEDTGRLKEWYNEYQIGDAYHRHASHLLGLFLGHININEADTPELYYAQQAETERWITANGGTHPDRSLMAMRAGFEDFAFANMTCGIVGTGYGHAAVMQWMPIASSIAESVVDSRFDQINLMENLPSAWSSGTIKGIRARGGYQLSMTWENGELINCVIDSPTGETPRVLYKGEPVVLSEDARFTVNRASATLEDLIYEAQEKLEGKYTEESKNALKAALESNDYDMISAALLAMVPVNFVEHEVSIKTEKGLSVLTEKDQMLQLTANSNKEDAEYKWSIEKTGGGDAGQIAAIDENGVVTAVGGGRVTVTAAIKGEARSEASIDLFVELGSDSIAETVDDRDSRIQYSSGWGTWEEAKHLNGTITYSSAPGATATLDFTGTGIDFIGSSAAHIGDFKVTIDGEVTAERIDSGENGYAVAVYSNKTLEDGNHSITIEGLGSRLDIDGFNVYEKVDAATDRKDIIAEYNKALKVTDEEKYTEESWGLFKAAIENAAAVINNFDAAQEDIEQKKDELKSAREELKDRKPEYTLSVIRGTGAGAFEEGETVTVTADEAEEGERFKDWTVEGMQISDNTQSSVTFTMPGNDVSFTANYEKVPVVSDDAGIAEVLVKGIKGIIKENIITVVLPAGSGLTEDPDDIVITPEHENAKVEDLKTDDQGATWSFTVTAEDGETVEEYTINVSEAEDIKGENEADVAAAKAFVEDKDWTIQMDTANSQELVAGYVQEQLESLIPEGVEAVLEMGTVTPANAGTLENQEGTDGHYSFKVVLSKGADADKAEGLAEIGDAKITAVLYGANPKVTVNVESKETITSGDKIILTATAEDIMDPVYKWYKNSVSSTTGAAAIGADDSRLELTAELGTNYYYCEVNGTVSNIVKIKASERVYEIVSGDTDKSWQAGDKDGLTIKVDASFKKYTGTEVDGVPVKKEYLTVESGSSTVTLKPEYLEGLEPGKHTVVILFADGRAETEFAITKGGEPAKPGDTTKPGTDSKPGDTTKPGTDSKPGSTAKPGGTSSDKGTPKTGDQTNVIFGFAVCGICVIAILAVLIMKRKKGRK